MKVIKDFKNYLDHIEALAKPLDSKQKAELENILGVVLTLLVNLKKGSHLGKIKFPWE